MSFDGIDLSNCIFFVPPNNNKIKISHMQCDLKNLRSFEINLDAAPDVANYEFAVFMNRGNENKCEPYYSVLFAKTSNPTLFVWNLCGKPMPLNPLNVTFKRAQLRNETANTLLSTLFPLELRRGLSLLIIGKNSLAKFVFEEYLNEEGIAFPWPPNQMLIKNVLKRVNGKINLGMSCLGFGADKTISKALQNNVLLMRRKTQFKKKCFNKKHCVQCKTQQTATHKLKKCSRCQHVRYCGRHCQKMDWNVNHRYHCQQK